MTKDWENASEEILNDNGGLAICSVAFSQIAKLYCTIRIHAAVKNRNRELAQPQKRKGRKQLKILHV